MNAGFLHSALFFHSALPFLSALFLCGLGACATARVEGERETSDEARLDRTSLRGKYEDHFQIGAAVDGASYRTHEELLSSHFNSVTAENEMKFESLQRHQGSFTYHNADSIVAFAEERGLAVRGHALVWHRQNPAWLFSDGEGGLASPELLLERMRTHIRHVMEHYRGRVYAWDVVNEAIMDDGDYRRGDEASEDNRSLWFEILGEQYIEEAFRAAHEVDPEARLFYNDYFNYLPARREGITAMLRGLLDDDVPLHGVGLQAHLGLAQSPNENSHAHYQTVENMEAAIEAYSALGLEVQITEMDVSLYVGGVQYDEDSFYTEETFTEELAEQQAERYREFFELFREHSDVITSVTFWGVADDNTWLSEFASGRQDFPLLFDTKHQPKPAFDAVMDF